MEEEKKWCVYRHLFPNGKSYIGITCTSLEKRFGLNGSGYARHQRKMYRAIQKYGWNNIKHEIIERDINSLEEANSREQYWIKYYDSFYNGYNSTFGGEGTLGRQFSDEERERISRRVSGTGNPMYGRSGKLAPNYGAKFSEEHKRLISEAQKGKIISESTKEKQSKIAKQRYKNKENHPMYGRKHKQESIKNMILHRRSYKGVNNPNYGKHNIKISRQVIQFSKDYKKILEYTSIAEASRIINIDASSISKVCRGKQKTAGGYIWRYADEIENNTLEEIVDE